MVAVPKNKKSKSRRDMRRNNFKLKPINIVECPRCHSKKIAHRVCANCGYYNNIEIIKIETKSKEKSKEKGKAAAKGSARGKKVKIEEGKNEKYKAQNE